MWTQGINAAIVLEQKGINVDKARELPSSKANVCTGRKVPIVRELQSARAGMGQVHDYLQGFGNKQINEQS